VPGPSTGHAAGRSALTVTSPGRLACRTAGPPDSADVLVLLHAFPLSSAMWQPQLEAAPPGWRIIAPDLPGFGDTPAIGGPLTMAAAADRVALLLDDLGVRRVVLGGLSMGGYVAFALLRRHPGLLRALALCDTRAAPDTEDVRRGRLHSAARIRRAGPAEFLEGMLDRLLSPRSRQQPELVARVRSLMADATTDGIVAALHGMAARPDATPLLRAIGVPALVVVGADDTITPVAETQLLARAIPGARLEIIDDAGHLPNLENPAPFNRVLHRFLDTLPQQQP
jgi:pimeloyl-ACP methyl ester carboxylesterase